MGRLQANKSVDGDNGVMKRVKKWMKTLFKDDQPTADAQAKIDAHAATLTNVVNTSTSFMFDPTPENQQQISTSDRPYPQTQIMTNRQQNLDLNRGDQFQFMSREGRDRKILEDNDLTYEQYVAARNRRQGRK